MVANTKLISKLSDNNFWEEGEETTKSNWMLYDNAFDISLSSVGTNYIYIFLNELKIMLH